MSVTVHEVLGELRASALDQRAKADRYWIKTDKVSGIGNDPNDWSREVGDPRYILDLLARVVTVSMETMTTVDSLPELAVRDDQ